MITYNLKEKDSLMELSAEDLRYSIENLKQTE